MMCMAVMWRRPTSLSSGIDFREKVPAKGLPQCAAISPGLKGCGL